MTRRSTRVVFGDSKVASVMSTTSVISGGMAGAVSFSSSGSSTTAGGPRPSPSLPDQDLDESAMELPSGSRVEGDKQLGDEAYFERGDDVETKLAANELKNWRWLADRSPGFAVKGSNVHVITCPNVFYKTLLDKVSSAKKRISLASLYFGNGTLEHDLVEAIQDSVTKHPDLKVNVLLDYTRGSRGEDNSRTMLQPLLQQSDACHVFLYHTPTLRGLVKRWLPPRWNEIIGLQHMKIYLFDDSVLISGANLSNDYFTNRQDRYLLIEDSSEMADFFDSLVHKVSHFSFSVNGKNELCLNPGWNIHPSDGNQEEFVKQAKGSIVAFYEEWKQSNPKRLLAFLQQPSKVESSSIKDDTWIFPMIQMGALDVFMDHEATCEVFRKAPFNSTVKLATGYFNLTSEYINTIVGDSTASYEILMAHPKANGFLGARGFAGGIPAAYTLLAKKFFENVRSQGQHKRISMWEYIRPKWTFHAKGLWFYPVGAKLPMLTLVGSPNFGHRSVHRDLETQLYLITLNKGLRQKLNEEQANVFENAKPFSSLEIVKPERSVPMWVRMVILIFRNFF
ncbi:CDP-diacylglycerol--glycerol-3-phosphate 3-phosphatidyltransferase, mitochondrial [Orchesella cincta]|uniref:CDP-diacylglycerol--glycerol-3-phosphate 3-phosphatidyltransferase n=1 Tax=Orchesella cincta TaxID=48709 RepID=A0A1D2MHR6_ORCCI|nr:CDP-diacylglycerol--glycerol-3-phosphate 3-phosphatidyltransferase, mitochondrial [Orchesella cincta]